MEFAFCTISEVLTYIGFTPFQFVPVSILTHNVSHKRDSVLLALRTVLLRGVLFVFAIGFLLGGVCGVLVMCLLQINRRYHEEDKE